MGVCAGIELLGASGLQYWLRPFISLQPEPKPRNTNRGFRRYNLEKIQAIQPFLQYFGNVRERTMSVARSIPADKIDWTRSPGKFRLGDLLRHIAVAERYMWAENVQGKPARYTTHGKELADGLDNILPFMDRLHAESVEIFSRLTPEDLQRKCITPGNSPITTWKWLRLMTEHEIHHRGQVYLYLNMLEVPTPPLYELRFAGRKFSIHVKMSVREIKSNVFAIDDDVTKISDAASSRCPLELVPDR